MHYYKVIKNGEEIGYISSSNLRYWNEDLQKMYGCREDKAEYIFINNTYYTTYWFNIEKPSMRGRYEFVDLEIISKEEYLEKLG